MLADAAGISKGKSIYKRTNGKWYAQQMEAPYNNPGCMGFHLCGAYQRNKARKRGLLDEYEQPDEENVQLIQQSNEQIHAWMKKRFSE